MPQFKLRPKARQDLADTWRYTLKTWGEVQADTYIRDLNRAFHTLAEQPYMGTDCEFIKSVTGNIQLVNISFFIARFALAIKTGLMLDLLTGKVRVTDIQNPTLTPEIL